MALELKMKVVKQRREEHDLGGKSSFCTGQGETMRKPGDLKDQSPRESYKGSLHEGREWS